MENVARVWKMLRGCGKLRRAWVWKCVVGVKKGDMYKWGSMLSMLVKVSVGQKFLVGLSKENVLFNIVE